MIQRGSSLIGSSELLTRGLLIRSEYSPVFATLLKADSDIKRLSLSNSEDLTVVQDPLTLRYFFVNLSGLLGTNPAATPL